MTALPLASGARGLPWDPKHPSIHLFESLGRTHAFLPNGSRVYGLSEDLAADFAADVLERLHLNDHTFINDEPVHSPPVRALSLAIAQKCNLACTYCYAQEGSFGGAPKEMPLDVALKAVDLLFRDAKAGERVNLAFLGGEPLTNRSGVKAATEYAFDLAEAKEVRIGFSLTTNGTLLTPEDAEFFERYGFAVTISLDGIGSTHDRLRPFKSGRGSYERILERVQPLLRSQNKMQVSARITVTPSNLDLPRTLDEFTRLRFFSVGFSPMLSSPAGRNQMNADALDQMLEQMIACGRLFEERVANGERYPFLNMVNALKEIHLGTHRPYPCGAGAGYMGVSADGALFGCHRFVDDERVKFGNVFDGVDRSTQNRWLAERHVHRQEPCVSCWARYLCGGGCHHEVLNRGRAACDYIRGWLHYCLQAYVRLRAEAPWYFGCD